MVILINSKAVYKILGCYVKCKWIYWYTQRNIKQKQDKSFFYVWKCIKNSALYNNHPHSTHSWFIKANISSKRHTLLLLTFFITFQKAQRRGLQIIIKQYILCNMLEYAIKKNLNFKQVKQILKQL